VNDTDPVGVVVPLAGVTVALNVTLLPPTTELGVAVMDVVVAVPVTVTVVDADDEPNVVVAGK
jgi:hypothetical protein